MTDNEPTVQVPVSLIEALRDEYYDPKPGVYDPVDPIVALLARATAQKNGLATAETLRSQGPHPKVTVLGRNDASLAAAEPTRIEDLAPGTLLRRIIDTAVQARPSYLRSDIIRLVKDIDPSTIRDVTPPKEN